jgi:hypothetical protein
MPTPMKLRKASVKIAVGIPKVRATMIGVSAFGSMCRMISRMSFAPIERAAMTKSFSRRERNCARTRRARPTQLVRPITRKILSRPRPNIDISRTTKRSVGKGVHHIHEAHQDEVDLAAEEAGGGTDRHADRQHDDLRHQPDQQGDPRAPRSPG